MKCSTRARVLALALGVAGATGCGGESKVVRVYDGRIIAGAYVPPEAYASYLKGVLAEEAGDLRTALSAYEQAAREDDEDPEPRTRAGDVRCRLDPKDKAADAAFAAALKIDPEYAAAGAAKAVCAGLRDRPGEGLAIVEQVSPGDRIGVALEASRIRLAARRSRSEADAWMRKRAIALTIASGQHPAAWEALATWGRARSDDELLARGLEGLAFTAPMRSAEVEQGALDLLGVGQAALARRVAARLADASVERGILGIRDATVARLAVDEAILAGDEAAAQRRATRGHVALGEVAARALILERPDVAAPMARVLFAADPTNGCAMMVLGTIAARTGQPPPSSELPSTKAPPADRPATSCVVVFAERLATWAGPELARSWVAQVGALPMTPHDPVAGPALVGLAARGVIAEAALPMELRLELSARRREAPPRVDPATLDPRGAHGDALDPKHALLWHTLVDPNGAPAKALLARMQDAAERDPIIGFSLARAVLASPSGPPSAGALAAVRLALAAAPADPLLLAIAVEIAKRAGRAEDVPRARVRLMAVAQTPAERALAGD